jgi:hypothetical protein
MPQGMRRGAPIMSDYDDRRAMERCEASYLREPDWRTSGPCQSCGAHTSAVAICEACAGEIQLRELEHGIGGPA